MGGKARWAMRRGVFVVAAAVAALVLSGASCNITNPPVGGGGTSGSSGTAQATLGPTVSTHVSSVSSPVSRGQTATLLATATAGSSCSITVTYKSGPSKAKTLQPKTADSSGHVEWSWKIGSRTIAGTWPIVVKCAPGGEADAEFTVS